MKKNIALLYFLLLIPCWTFSQNVGIGVINPVRAKLEVNGAVGFTTAIFGGESTGISLQRNWPSVGFNQYYDGSSRYIGNGYASVIYVDPGAGYMAFDMFGSGTTNSTVTSVNRSLTLTTGGNVGIKSYGYPDISLFVPRLTNTSGALVIGGTTHNSRFYYGVNEDTYIRAGKDGSRVVLNDITNGLTQIGANSSNTTEVYGKLYGYGSSPLATTAMNLVPLGVVEYSGNLFNISSGSFPTNYTNLVGNFVTGSSGFYSNNSTVADYINITLPFDNSIFSQYSMVIGMNNLNFNGDAGVSGGNALITRLYSNVVTSGSPHYLIEVGVDDFGNVGAYEVASISGKVIFYGLR